MSTSNKKRDYYDVLGVSRNASDEDINTMSVSNRAQSVNPNNSTVDDSGDFEW